MRGLPALLLALALAATAGAEPLQAIPELRARVTDRTGTLTAAEQSALERKLADFEAQKGAQLAVLIVATTEPEAIEQYAIRVAEAWRLGREASDDGALLLVAKGDRALRIEVGYGLEGALTDALCNRIIDQAIVPRFRAGDFAGGIDAGIDAMLRVIDGEELPPPEPGWTPDAIPGIESLPFVVMAIPVAALALRRRLGAVWSAMLAGGLMLLVVWVVTRVLQVALGFGVATALFVALAGHRPVPGVHRGGHVGWGGGLGRGGGFGGGGFSGGGGGFGGGGASGRW